MSKDAQIATLQERIDELFLENERLKSGINFKINDRGGVCIMGIGKYPLHLFPEQVLRLLDKKNDLQQFIEENTQNLSWLKKK
jgi:hypothetical protein